MLDELLSLLGKTKTYDLAQPYRVGMPHHPVHPAFTFGMSKAHGEFMRGEASSAAENFSLGGHVGTHIDAFCHFSKDSKLYGGIDVKPLQSYREGIRHLSVDTIEPIVRRGVLVDLTRLEGVDVVPEDFAAGADTLEAALSRQGSEVREGDVVLVRTGWDLYWDNPTKYINELRSPGPNLEAAEWLSTKGIFAAGSDTLAFEVIPSKTMPVHVHFLVEKGIHIIEALNLEALSKNQVWEFVFVAAPLKIEGGTGAPIRPMALAADGTR